MRDIDVTVVGNAGGDAEKFDLPSGQQVTRFRLAVNARIRDRESGEYRDGPTTWFEVSAWNQLGQNVAESVRRGERVLVVGRLKVEDYTDRDGKERTSVRITADHVGHDLQLGSSRFSRVVRSSQAGPVEGDGGGEGGGDAGSPQEPPDELEDAAGQWLEPGLEAERDAVA